MGRSFDEFYLSSRDRLALHVAALTGDPAEAHDHVQEAFIRAWTRWDRVADYDDPEAWVRRVACNQAVSRWRRTRRMVLRAEPDAEVAEYSPEQLVLFDALARLPVREREALVLHYLIGYSVDEVAEQLGAPSGTVKSWLSRGRGHLGAQLAEEISHERG